MFVTEFGSGPAILLIHGIYAGASSFEFRKLAPLLGRNHRVVVLDLIGCGLSEMPPLDYSGELFVEQVVDAIGQLFDGPLTLVGSSLGGAFAIRAATRAPDRVTRLVTIAPTGLAACSIRSRPRRCARLRHSCVRPCSEKAPSTHLRAVRRSDGSCANRPTATRPS